MEEFTIYMTSISLVIILLMIKLSLQMTKRPCYKNLPPSPPGLPVIGHLHLLKAPLHRTLHRLSAQYGGDKSVLFLRFGTRQVAVISSPSAVEECFTKNDVLLANRPSLMVTKHFGYNNTTMISAPYGEHWRNLRRIGAMEIFSASRLNTFVNTRRDEVNRLLLHIHRVSVLHGRVELRSTFSHLLFNVVMRMVAGKRYYGDDVAEDDDEARQFREIMSAIVVGNGGAGNLGDFLPFLNWGPRGYEKRVEKLAKKTDKFLQRLVNEQRCHRQNNTMIGHLLSLQDLQPENYTDQIIKGFALVLLLAATDASAVTLEWAMSNLLNHPEELKKVKVEINRKIGKQRLLEESDITKLGQLKNVVSETLRMCPAVPLLVPHYASSDCTVSGYNVPRGTILLVNAWAIHRDPSLWVDAESFRPERFNETEAGDHGLGYKHMPFGLGRRACPGLGLAHRVVGLTLGSLIQCFEWERLSEEMVDMTEGKGVTMPKAVPLEAICRARPIIDAVKLTESSNAV